MELYSSRTTAGRQGVATEPILRRERTTLGGHLEDSIRRPHSLLRRIARLPYVKAGARARSFVRGHYQAVMLSGLLTIVRLYGDGR